MMRSSRGTLENPGKQVAQKRGLNRALQDLGLGEFRRQLAYKLEHRGGWLLALSPAYTSQTCPDPDCGHVSADNRQTQADFVCVACGYANNADEVGAINILDKGLSAFASKQPQDYAGLACPVRGQQTPSSRNQLSAQATARAPEESCPF